LIGSVFEVEVRFPFNNPEEAYRTLPFLHTCLTKERSWSDRFYGLDIFKSGLLLRVSTSFTGQEGQRVDLGWKGPDIGKLANIRKEIEEDITRGIASSSILAQLGAKTDADSCDEVIREIQGLGHKQFMASKGKNRIGYYKPYEIDVKLMTCRDIKWPVIVELEKKAHTWSEAAQCERELDKICSAFNLERRMIRQEPPAMLYRRFYTFGE